MKTNIVKSAVTAIAAAAFAWLGTAPKADAQYSNRVHVRVGCDSYRSSSYHTERYLIGYDSCGRPVWGYRQVRRVCYPVVRPVPCHPPVYRPSYRPRPVPYCNSRSAGHGYRR